MQETPLFIENETKITVVVSFNAVRSKVRTYLLDMPVHASLRTKTHMPLSKIRMGAYKAILRLVQADASQGFLT